MAAALLALLGVMSVHPASSTVAHAAGEIAKLPSANPANFTPNVLNGEVDAIVQIGNRIVIGGRFTQVANAVQNGGQVYNRTNIAAFDATTGVIDTGFAPVLSSHVNTLLSTGDGTTVYIGGDFNTVNGTNRRKVARVNVGTGALVTSFNANGPNGQVKDMKLVNGLLYVGGSFTSINNQARGGLATLNPTTGALTAKVNLTLTGTQNGGSPNVYKFDITPAGDRLLLIGNFTAVGGQSRRQAAMLDLSPAVATVASWSTTWYQSTCSSSFESYMRDMDISPDGAFAIISTTGAYRANQSCDTISRFEVYPNGVVTPTWVSYTGGDTTYAVEVANGVVFVGGHMRWVNNPTAADTAGTGAVPRQGILALDPINGMPFSWNPGRERGVGVFDFFVTDAGLWAGSDTDRWADEVRQRLAFFPFSTGTLVPASGIGALPSDVFLVGRTAGTTGTDPSVLHRVNAGGPALASADDGPGWSADTNSTSSLRNSGSSTASFINVGVIDGSVPSGDFDRTPVAIFATERSDPSGGQEMQWNFPVAAGTPIQVRLYLANRSTSTDEIGERIFDIDIDGANVVNDIDIVASHRHNVGTMRSFDITSDGTVNVLFRHGAANNPLINAIEIIRTDVTGNGTLGVQDEVQRRFYNGGSLAAPNTVLAGTLPWRNVRGSFMVNGTLFTGNVDGSMVKRTFDGVTFGPAQPVALYGNTMIADMPNVTGMFFDPTLGRLYYTLTGDSNLFYRYFTPEAGTLGAARFTASGAIAALNPSRVRGMFLSGGQIFFADSTTGNLSKIAFASNVVSGTAVVAENTVDWRARDMFVSTAAPVPASNTPPTAATFSSSCTFANCTFTDGGSTDLDGFVAGFAWDFGDGSPAGSGSPTTHVFPATGDYTVTLTVSDDDGATAQRQAVVHVEAAPNVAPVAAFTSSCSARLCSFDSVGSSDGDGVITGYAWTFGDGGTASGPTATHTYAADGSFSVTLTVTDDAAAQTSVSNDVEVSARAVTFRASSAASGTGGSASVAVPAVVEAGDQLVLFVTANVNTTLTTPAGWTLLGTQVDGTPDMRSWAFTRTAAATTGGSNVTATFGSTTTKSSRLLLAYAGASVPTIAASAVTGPSTTAHTTPAVTVTGDGSRVVSYWSDKSGGNAGWTLPGSVTSRQSSLGTGSGQITAAAGDSGPLDAGPWPGATATSSVASSKAIHWSVVIPSGDPTAAFTPDCAGLACTFDASASTDSNGSIVAYHWAFGDTTSGTGMSTGHTYAAAGTYDVVLTVTDDDGATSSATVQVALTTSPNQAPAAAFTQQCIALDCTFDASTSTDADGSIQSYSWNFGDGTSASGVAVSHSYATPGNYLVALTVTDDDLASGAASRDVTVSTALVAFRASAAANGSGAAAAVVVPAGVQSGDQLVLFVTANADTTIATPTGWTLLGTQVDGTPDMRSAVFTTTAGPTSAGSSVTATLGSTTAKSSRILLAYSAAAVPTVAASAVAGPSTVTHAAPAVDVAAAGSFVASYWSDKTSGNAGWTLPGTVTTRQASLGAGSGQITAAAGDAGPLPAGTHAAVSATSSIASAKAIHWSVVIPAA